MNNLHGEIVAGRWDLVKSVPGIDVSVNEKVAGVERYDINGGQSRFERWAGLTLYKFQGRWYEDVKELTQAILEDLDPATVQLFNSID